MSTESNTYAFRRAIEEILNDAGLPRYLQVSRIVELLEGHMVVHIMEIQTRAKGRPNRKNAKAQMTVRTSGDLRCSGLRVPVTSPSVSSPRKSRVCPTKMPLPFPRK